MAIGFRELILIVAELESLRKSDRITAAEYEKQRAAIVSSV